MNRLKKQYLEQVKPALKEKFKYSNVNQVPKIEKVVISSVTRDAVTSAKVVEAIQSELTAISGQKPVISRAKKSIASFKLREGQPLGAYVTLRNDRMYDFLERLITFALPRVRDFKGHSSKSFDGRGGYSMGIKEQIIFPEINYDKIDKIRGMGINIITTAKTSDEARDLLKGIGFPFKK